MLIETVIIFKIFIKESSYLINSSTNFGIFLIKKIKVSNKD